MVGQIICPPVTWTMSQISRVPKLGTKLTYLWPFFRFSWFNEAEELKSRHEFLSELFEIQQLLTKHCVKTPQLYSSRFWLGLLLHLNCFRVIKREINRCLVRKFTLFYLQQSLISIHLDKCDKHSFELNLTYSCRITECWHL